MTRSVGFRKHIWSSSDFIRLLNHHKNVRFPAKSTCHISRAITQCCPSGTSYTIYYGYDSLTYNEYVVQVLLFWYFLPYQKLRLPVYSPYFQITASLATWRPVYLLVCLFARLPVCLSTSLHARSPFHPPVIPVLVCLHASLLGYLSTCLIACIPVGLQAIPIDLQISGHSVCWNVIYSVACRQT